MNKKRKLYCETQIKLIKERMATGRMRFGDKKLLKDYQVELNGEIVGGKDW